TRRAFANGRGAHLHCQFTHDWILRSILFFPLVRPAPACHAFPVHPEQVKIFKAMPAAKKLELAATFYFSARHLKTQALKQRHPDWPESRLRREVNRLFLRASR
ncbi:MAG TPA: hypothetical protein P5204_06690, partial [Kiritimatiellia bacterium]|nr:hypothetical protein [Kiritimatiellia bacterium]